MREPDVLVPVVCPDCGTERLSRIPVSRVADALIAGESLKLKSPCHPVTWDARPLEIEQIREYLVAECIDLNGSRPSEGVPFGAMR